MDAVNGHISEEFGAVFDLLRLTRIMRALFPLTFIHFKRMLQTLPNMLHRLCYSSDAFVSWREDFLHQVPTVGEAHLWKGPSLCTWTILWPRLAWKQLEQYLEIWRDETTFLDDWFYHLCLTMCTQFPSSRFKREFGRATDDQGANDDHPYH